MRDPRFLIGDLGGRPRAIRAALVSSVAIAADGMGASVQTAARARMAKEEQNLIVYGRWLKKSRALKRRVGVKKRGDEG